MGVILLFLDEGTVLNLFDKLLQHHNDDIYPYHMPGHKRKPLTGECLIILIGKYESY